MKMGQILVRIPLLDSHIAALGRRWPLIQRIKASGIEIGTDETLQSVVGVVTNGSTGMTAAEMAQLPGLRVICAFGTGYERVDLEAAQARNIRVYNTPGVNDATVADHAIGLALAAARQIPARDRALRQGAWSEIRHPSATLSASVIGVIGMGRIGQGIARRAEAFGANVLYSARSPRAELPWTFVRNVADLASHADFLFAACPGGPETRHLVDFNVLKNLGKDGILVNVARGSVVDTQALLAALATGGIAAAGLDVFENEPGIPNALAAMDNVVMTPHVAGRSHSAMQRQFEIVSQTLEAVLSGAPPKDALV